MNPLWMPAGSVRAIMSLSILGSAIYMWVTGQEMTQAQELITTGALGGYFVMKQLSSGEAKPDGSQQVNLMDNRGELDER